MEYESLPMCDGSARIITFFKHNAAGDTICSGDAIAITASPAGLATMSSR